MSIVMYIIISLAIIGLSAQLFRDFTGFLISILIMIIIAFVMFVIFSHIARNRLSGGGGMGSSRSSPEMKKYREAVKRSREKYGNNQAKPTNSRRKNNKERKKRWRRRPNHLRLIKGKKSNDDDKDNRASF